MITVIGSLNCDFVTYVDKVPGPGETIQGELFELHLGGKGLNEAIASSRLTPTSDKNNSVRMWGKIGDDMYGKQMLNALIESKVNIELVETVKDSRVSSGTATILVETAQGGENRIMIVSGANGFLKPSDEEYAKNLAACGKGDFVILQNEYPDPLKTIEWISQNKKREDCQIAYNPSPFKKEWINSEILSKVSYLFLNLGEAVEVYRHLFKQFEFEIDDSKLSKASIIDKATKLSSQLYTELKGSTNLIITLGGSGCVYTSSEGEPKYQESCSILKENIKDTTGAGDTFLGGVISSLHSGKSIDESVKFASVASALAIQTKGAVESIPYYEDVIESIDSYFVKN